MNVSVFRLLTRKQAFYTIFVPFFFYIWNDSSLDYGVSDSELSQLFQQYGAVDSAKVIMDRDSGRSKGFGFVEMPVDDEAMQAISALDGQDVRGRNIVVKKAEPRR